MRLLEAATIQDMESHCGPKYQTKTECNAATVESAADEVLGLTAHAPEFEGVVDRDARSSLYGFIWD